jgi:signal peptidase I
MQNENIRPPRESRPSPGAAVSDPIARRPLIPALVWIGLILLTAALTGCRSFSAFYAVYLLGALGISVISLLFLGAIYRRGMPGIYPAFKKFTGYSIVAHYILHCLPRVDWTNAGLIGDGRAVFLYVLTLACTAAGIVFFILMSRKPVLVAFGVMSQEEAKDPALLKKNRKAKKRSLIGIILEWVDVFAYAVIVVLLVQIFLFQPFVVPTESMVPVFLSGDRPFTVELIAAPHLPLTPWRLPFIKQPGRGDVVMIANPRYPENHGVNLKKYLAQAIFKITFTLVNIDRTTAGGDEKADPLVKRIVGVPGEKLMMVDDVLYARTSSEPEYKPVAADVERYSQVDLWKLPADVRARIRNPYIGSSKREELAAWDARKNGTDPVALAAKLEVIWGSLLRRVIRMPAATVFAFERDELPKADSNIAALRDEWAKAAPAGAENRFSSSGVATEDLSLALALFTSQSTRAALEEFATAGAAASAGPTAYEKGSRALNLLMKTNLLARVFRDVELIASGAGIDDIGADPARAALINEARGLYDYLRFYDMRNFPEFPAGESFLGPDQYFAMGDNRYNSLDFRYSGTYGDRALDAADPASIRYASNLAPFALEKGFIDGYALIRVWPISRIGIIR